MVRVLYHSEEKMGFLQRVRHASATRSVGHQKGSLDVLSSCGNSAVYRDRNAQADAEIAYALGVSQILHIPALSLNDSDDEEHEQSSHVHNGKRCASLTARCRPRRLSESSLLSKGGSSTRQCDKEQLARNETSLEVTKRRERAASMISATSICDDRSYYSAWSRFGSIESSVIQDDAQKEKAEAFKEMPGPGTPNRTSLLPAEAEAALSTCAPPSANSLRDDLRSPSPTSGPGIEWVSGNKNAPGPDQVRCACANHCHYLTYNPAMPITTKPGVNPGSREELLEICRSLCGHWVSILPRSESLDSIYRAMGIGPIKRAVMNRLAVPMTMFFDENDTILQSWIHTPLGVRSMRGGLQGQETVDDDPDAGRWRGFLAVADHEIPAFCTTKPVRAFQHTRFNDKVGTVLETRCVLPDPELGRVLFVNYTLTPKNGKKSKLSANRYLSFVSEKPP